LSPDPANSQRPRPISTDCSQFAEGGDDRPEVDGAENQALAVEIVRVEMAGPMGVASNGRDGVGSLGSWLTSSAASGAWMVHEDRLQPRRNW
jgi:hypothetical protein